MHIERHDGEPLVTLADVRASHNVVAAFGDLEEARKAIIALEQSGVDPDAIALLGAWPAEADTSTEDPGVLRRRTSVSAVIGAAILGGLATLLFAGSSFGLFWPLISAAAAGAVIGAAVGWVTATGTSRAWQRTFAADGRGTVAVGVHSGDPGAIGLAEEVLATNAPMAMNRFGNQ